MPKNVAHHFFIFLYNTPMEPTEIEMTPEQQDVKYLQEQLEQTHYDLYRNVSEEIFADSLQKATEVEPEYFKIALQESLALIGDAHTYVPGIFNKQHPLLESKEIEGKMYIIGTSQEQSFLIGQEIKEINGYPVTEIISKISRLSSKENREILLKDVSVFMTSPLALKYYGFSKGDVTEITTNIGSTNIVEEKDAKIKIQNPLKWKTSELNNPTFLGNSDYRLRVIDNTLLFQYNSCTNRDRTKGELEDFKNKLLEIAKESDAIVIDLRQNSGGNTGIMADLFTRLPEDKKIYVAMGRKTFSSAIHHLLYLKKNKGGILIGENAGQRPNRFGDHKEIVLPNSKIRVSCSYKYFELLPGQDIDVIEPDINIPIKIEDYRNNTDPLNQWIKDNL